MGRLGGNLDAQQLVELLSVVSACEDEATAAHAAVERAAQALEAEASALVVGDRVVRSVGFAAGSDDHDVLVGVAAGQRVQIDVPGIGLCSVGAAELGDAEPSRLVIARFDLDFTVQEYNLIRGMARVLGLTLRMLRTLDAERRRQQLMQQLYGVQRAISRRAPLAEVLSMIVGGVHQVMGVEVDFAGLWLTDNMAPGQLTLAASAGPDEQRARWPGRLPVSAAGAIGRAVLTGRVAADETGGGGGPPEGTAARQLPDSALCLVAPVHETGEVAGGLLLSRSGLRPFTAADREKLLSFAEHVSLAMTDARTVRDMNEAMHDSLTGLASRALFLDRLGNELARTEGAQTCTALLFVDLDRFKQVNDTFGHSGGDALLVAVAERIRATIRGGDAAARFGGDEFAVMLRGATSHDQVVDVATRIIVALAAPFRIPGGVTDVGASVGIAISCRGQQDAEELVRRADLAMYRVKRTGRGGWLLFDPALDPGDNQRYAEDVDPLPGHPACPPAPSLDIPALRLGFVG